MASPETAKDGKAPEPSKAPESEAPAEAPATKEESDKPAEGSGLHTVLYSARRIVAVANMPCLPAASATESTEKPAQKADAGTKEAEPVAASAGEAEKPEEAETSVADATASAATPDKKKAAAARRKSAGPADKKLNKKASKARILHTDAKPGDHFFVKLKGFPQWPVVICDEDMLPQALIKSRPVTAKREDGTYREDYADGGKRIADRTFPVMYLHTNEL